MSSIGVNRPIDRLGRVVIPRELRSQLNIKDKDLFNIRAEDNKLILEKVIDKCVACGRDKDLVSYKDIVLCKKCIEELERK